MNILLAIPVITGWLAGWLINYLADFLPITLRLSHPECLNQQCKATFHWVDYLLFRSCRKCGQKRNLRTYLAQVLSVAAAIYIWLEPPRGLGFYLGFGLLVYLLVVTIIDIEQHWTLRPLSITGLILGAGAGLLANGWLSTLIGALVGFVAMLLFYLFGKVFTRFRTRRLGNEHSDGEEALGSGDITLATILGLMLGWPLIWFGLLLGIVISGIWSLIIILRLWLSRSYKKRALTTFIPYGSCYIIAAILLIYFPGWIVRIVPK